jgi:hypothetical protein
MKKWWKTRDWRALGRFSVQSVGTMAASFAMVLIFAAVFDVVYFYVSRMFWALGSAFGVRGAEAALVVLVFGAAWLAFQFKMRQQGWYGLCEVGFGIGSAATVARTMVPGSSTLPQWMALVGCGYVMVRGMTNVRELREKKMAKEGIISTSVPIPSPNP